MGRFLSKQMDLIDEIANKTIFDSNFDPEEWCEYDANILERAAKMIRDALRDDND